MATSAPTTYSLDGTLLEACSCMAPCPCWIGDDPDGGKCDGLVAYHVDKGQIRGVDVSDLSVVLAAQIPGNVLAGNWRVVLYVDDRATPEQREALLDTLLARPPLPSPGSSSSPRSRSAASRRAAARWVSSHATTVRGWVAPGGWDCATVSFAWAAAGR